MTEALFAAAMRNIAPLDGAGDLAVLLSFEQGHAFDSEELRSAVEGNGGRVTAILNFTGTVGAEMPVGGLVSMLEEHPSLHADLDEPGELEKGKGHVPG